MKNYIITKPSIPVSYTHLDVYKRQAVELMCETDLPISDIIAAVGYENGSYFHRVFKERYHTTPRAFRVANGKEERVRL